MKRAKKLSKKAKQGKKELEKDEFNMAILLSLVPLMVFSLFGQMGLF